MKETTQSIGEWADQEWGKEDALERSAWITQAADYVTEAIDKPDVPVAHALAELAISCWALAYTLEIDLDAEIDNQMATNRAFTQARGRKES